MDQVQLRELLETLHEDLPTEHDADDETRALLQAVRADIAALLERGDAPPELPAGGLERLQGAAAAFAADHPKAAGLLRRVLDSLEKLGI